MEERFLPDVAKKGDTNLLFRTKRRNTEATFVVSKIKLETIKRKKEFECLVTNGFWLREGPLKSVILFREDCQLETNFYKIIYAVTVSRKTTKKAVVRNRIKRLLRESFRKVASEDFPNDIWKIHYILFQWTVAPQRACEINLWAVYPTVKKLIETAIFKHYVKVKGLCN